MPRSETGSGGHAEVHHDAGQTVRVRIGLLAKLMSLMACVVIVVVATLTVYFPLRQLSALEALLLHRANTYGKLISHQLRSAVAFDDRETARETFEAAAQDPLVTGLGIYADGRPLRIHGQLSPLAQAAGAKLFSQRIYNLDDRLIAVFPVRSLEGPTGTLTFELSKRSLEQSRQQLVRGALLVGALVLALALALTFLVVRKLTRRIRAIAGAAMAVAGGDLNRRDLELGSADEIGIVAGSFNSMVNQLRTLFERIKKSAQEEQERLEALVAARTSELAERNQNLKLVMDNVEQGFLTIHRDGTIAGEHSLAIERWFGAPVAKTPFATYFERVAPGRGAWFELAWEQITDGVLPLELAVAQAELALAVGERLYTVSIKPILRDDGHFDAALIVVCDVTAAIARERAAELEAENVNLMRRLLEDRSVIDDFSEDAERLMTVIEARGPDEALFRRALHTLKGNAGMLGLTTIARACHELESELAQGESLQDLRLQPLLVAHSHLRSKLAELLAGFGPEAANIDELDRSELLSAIHARKPYAVLEQLVRGFALERLQPRLERAAEQVRALATRLGKDPVRVEVQCERIRLDRRDWQPLAAELPHLLRNAVDHGLETRDQRLAAQKPEVGSVHLRAFARAGGIVIEVEDRGRGIAWDRVEQRARDLGLVERTSVSEAGLSEALFAQGLSTSDSVTEISGRGVGLSAIREVVSRRGGRVSVESRSGLFTKISLFWPVGSDHIADPSAPASPSANQLSP
jgi:two-component system chemotaxis sensor kinase CheA